MKPIIILATLSLVAPSILSADEGSELFGQLCSGCHTLSGPPNAAPPMFAVKQHVLRRYPDKESFVEQIVNWVGNPRHSDALMPGAVRRFGVMPRLPYTEEQVRQVAGFIYDADMRPNQWERGRRGMGYPGMGRPGMGGPGMGGPGMRGPGMGYPGCPECGPERW